MLKIPTPILKFQAFAHLNFSSSTIHIENHFIIETGISVKHHLIFGVLSLTDLYITSYLMCRKNLNSFKTFIIYILKVLEKWKYTSLY